MKFNNNKELAAYLKVSEAAISRWIQDDLPTEMSNGLSYSFELASVLEWLRNKSPRHRRFVEKLERDWSGEK